MLTLDEIGLKHGTDKASTIHNYLYFYDRRLSHLREQAFTMYEIGVYRGSSVMMWEEYFPHALIVGIDIEPGSTIHGSDRIKVRIGDQSSVKFLFEVLKEFGSPRLVLDDGSHRWDHQIQSLQCLLPFVQAGGHYILEDLHTSSEHMQADYRGKSRITAFEYMTHLTRMVNLHDVAGLQEIYDNFIYAHYSEIESIEYIRRSAIITKRTF